MSTTKWCHTRVPKNGVSRSKRLLKPQPLPHQYWGLDLAPASRRRGMVRNVVRLWTIYQCFGTVTKEIGTPAERRVEVRWVSSEKLTD
jgi:hypothetical protein